MILMNIIIYPFVKIGVFRCHNVDIILLNNIPVDIAL